MSDDELYSSAVSEVRAIRDRLTFLDRLAAEPTATVDSLRRDDLTAAARSAGFRNPDLAAKLLAADDGEPDVLVQKLAEAEPYMVAAGLVGEMNQALRSRRGSSPMADGQPADMNAALRAGRTGRTVRSG